MTTARDDDVATGEAETPAVQCLDIVKRFEGGIQALHGVDLACPRGRIVVLVGPSGCGKTTLLRCIAGLETPTTGSILIEGEDVTHVDGQHRGVAMVFQNYALYPSKTARENIEFPLRMSKIPREERAERTRAVAGILRIEGLLDRRPAELSGGQKQRVGLGRALVRGPRVLLMDEPLSSLDAQLRVEMRAEILALQRQVGTTIVYVTHDQTEAMTLGDEIVVLREGRIEQTGSPEEVFERPASTFVGRFIGDMNVLAASVEHGVMRTEGGAELSLSGELATRHRDLRIGVRPERITRGRAGAGELGWRGRVRLVEMLGSERLIHLEVGDSSVRVREPVAGPCEVGEEVDVRAHIEDVHLFSAGEGEPRLAPDEGASPRATDALER